MIYLITMKTIYLSNDDIITALNFAIYTVDKHYHRMWHDRKVGISKIGIGKLGEIAISKYLSLQGIKTVVNLRSNTGHDDGDLLLWEEILEIKTKKFKNKLPPLDQIFLHIPVDQYEKIILRDVAAVIAVALSHNQEINEQTILLEMNIIGGLILNEYDKIKILHKAGEEIVPGFILPPPDSYAVRWSELDDFENILTKIKQTIKRNIYTFIKGKEPCSYEEIINGLKYSEEIINQITKKLIKENLLKEEW